MKFWFICLVIHFILAIGRVLGHILAIKFDFETAERSERAENYVFIFMLHAILFDFVNFLIQNR